MWPFRRHHEPEPTTEAMEAQRAAKAALSNEARRAAEVARVANALRNTRMRNHFSETMEALMKGTE